MVAHNALGWYGWGSGAHAGLSLHRVSMQCKKSYGGQSRGSGQVVLTQHRPVVHRGNCKNAMKDSRSRTNPPLQMIPPREKNQLELGSALRPLQSLPGSVAPEACLALHRQQRKNLRPLFEGSRMPAPFAGRGRGLGLGLRASPRQCVVGCTHARSAGRSCVTAWAPSASPAVRWRAAAGGRHQKLSTCRFGTTCTETSRSAHAVSGVDAPQAPPRPPQVACPLCACRSTAGLRRGPWMNPAHTTRTHDTSCGLVSRRRQPSYVGTYVVGCRGLR